MNTKLAMALLAAVLSASILGAQEGPLPMEQIVVTATRTATTVLDSPDHVTVVSAEQIAASGAVSVAEVLSQQAGLSVTDNGTIGSVQSLQIRGSTTNQVLVLIDGVRANDSREGGVDLSQIPVENIERIEIVRGGSSALYGTDAVGGVVNIITKTKAERLITLNVQNGSYIPRAAVVVSESLPTATETRVAANPLDLVDTQKVAVQVSKALGPVDLLMTGSFTRADNGFVWMDSQYVDGFRRRTNADLLAGDGFLSLNAPLGLGRIGLKAQAGYQSVGAPGSIDTTRLPFGYGYLFSTDARQQRATSQALASYSSPHFLSPVLTLDAKLFYKFSRLDYQNPNPTDFSEVAVDDSHTLHSFGLDVMQEMQGLDLVHFVYGGNLLYDYVDSTAIGQKDRLSGGAFLETPLYLLPRLTVTPMIRYDLYSDFPNSFNYKLGVVYNLTENAALKASGGKSYRAPTLNDLYWPNDGFTSGNLALRPETGYTADLGFSLASDRVEWNLFAFTRYVLDGIQWVYTTIFQPLNIGEALYPGAETDLKFAIFKNLYFSAGYTFLYSYVLKSATASYTFADDRRAAYAPLHTADAALQYDNGRTLLRIDGQYVGDRFTGVEGELGTQELGWYLVLNAEVRQKLSATLTLTLAGKNLLNQVYQTVSGYVMPPLSFWLGAELRF